MSNIVKFSNEFASAELILMQDGKARLRAVHSRRRQRGHGSELMREVIRYAEDHDLELYLVVQRFGRPAKAMDNTQLETFYSKFGFEKIEHQGKFIMMRRRRSQN
jgi:GNAT superfamily N-acetyltransferase